MTGVRRRGPGSSAPAETPGAPPEGGDGPRRGRSTWQGPVPAELDPVAPGPRRRGSSAADPGPVDDGAKIPGTHQTVVRRNASGGDTTPSTGVRRTGRASEQSRDGHDVHLGDDLDADDRASDAEEGEAAPENPWRQPRTILLAVLAGVLALVLVIMLVLILRPKTSDPVAISVPVALTGVNAPKGLTLGVVVSIGQGAVEGAEWASAAEGAAVAKARLVEGGSEIALIVENDHGTSDGAKAAVTSLHEKGARGIVFATSGEHLAAGVTAAIEAKLPVVLAYETIPDSARPAAVWTLAPGEKALEAAYRGAIGEFTNPVLIAAGPGVPDGLAFSETLRASGSDLAPVADAAAARAGADASAHHAYPGTDLAEKEQPKSEKKPADALVISGNARSLATIVKELQARNVSVPLVLAPAAGSPGFTRSLQEQGGSVTASLETIGVNVGDAAALGSGTQARAASAFLQEVRLLAADPEAKNLSGDGPFSDVAPWADVRSHDAVVALAAAAGKAGSTSPEQIGQELAKLQLTASDGAAGTLLDFRRKEAASGRVQLLHATGQSLGLRPTSDAPLTWFPAPDSGQ